MFHNSNINVVSISSGINHLYLWNNECKLLCCCLERNIYLFYDAMRASERLNESYHNNGLIETQTVIIMRLIAQARARKQSI